MRSSEPATRESDTMPKIPASEVKRIGEALLIAAGALPEEAETVARQCAAANLAGHDSHGILQIPGYIERMKRGEIVPGAPWTIVEESPTTTVVDGNWGFGYTVSYFKVTPTTEK